MSKIFVSHSSKDRKIAARICAALEQKGLTCWIASRDINPGENFGEAIVNAIRTSKVMLLVFTQNANNSDEIKKELVLAGHNRLIVIPVRVEDIEPGGAFAYELATRQWIDLFEDWDREMERLGAWIQKTLTLVESGPPSPIPAAPARVETDLARTLTPDRPGQPSPVSVPSGMEAVVPAPPESPAAPPSSSQAIGDPVDTTSGPAIATMVATATEAGAGPAAPEVVTGDAPSPSAAAPGAPDPGVARASGRPEAKPDLLDRPPSAARAPAATVLPLPSSPAPAPAGPPRPSGAFGPTVQPLPPAAPPAAPPTPTAPTAPIRPGAVSLRRERALSWLVLAIAVARIFIIGISALGPAIVDGETFLLGYAATAILAVVEIEAASITWRRMDRTATSFRIRAAVVLLLELASAGFGLVLMLLRCANRSCLVESRERAFWFVLEYYVIAIPAFVCMLLLYRTWLGAAGRAADGPAGAAAPT